MTFTALKNDKLKISLSSDEALRFFGGADNIDQSDPTTRLAIKLLFKKALLNCNFRPGSCSMMVEIVKTALGGCDIYFTKSRKEPPAPGRNNFALMYFADLKSALRASAALKNTDEIRESRFFRAGKNYCLAVWFDRSFPLSLLFEFSDSVSRDPLSLAGAEEYGRELIERNAIEILAQL
jgi:hypothetical protein